ncbi:uncharacterized protein LOC121247365 [Juglans microcarpa x Juglans regia]|uniref:uncharacterized protein LOC121247365 n=1 Tax=Juglans microcarpa x Juglans regia TaxID=2249226 RepID=UPI001B7D9DD8|nr:uncharacterized protein LOC121247365 [Juglans microcarpa x Juglans regia]
MGNTTGNPMPKMIFWRKLEEGWLKINFDAATDSKNQKVGVGVIIRDHNGEQMAACSEPNLLLPQPLIAEAAAMRKAIELCIELGFNRVIIEGDAKVILEAVVNPNTCWTAYGQIIQDVKESLKELNDWKIIFVRRKRNEVAHILAKMAVSRGNAMLG